MPDVEKTLPQQIIETSQAFTQTLQMENAVFQAQLNGAVEMTVNALQSMIALCKEAVSVASAGNTQTQQHLTDSVQQALSDIQKTTNQSPAPSSTEPLPANAASNALPEPPVLHNIEISYENAVQAQQQAYMLQQAAASQTISTLLTVVTAALSVAVKEAESGN